MPTGSSSKIRALFPAAPIGSTRHILSFVYFTFISYLSIGLPLAVLPSYVHLRMGYSATLAGFVISVQYIATLASRPWTGRICDRSGARAAVLWGIALSTLSGVILFAALLLHSARWLSLAVLILSRLLLGLGESLSSTGSSLWGILGAGPSNTARVITFNGISIYSGIAIGAPVGVELSRHWGLPSIGVVTVLICGFSFFIACRKAPVAVLHGEHLPFTKILGRILPHGTALATGGIGYNVLATFITLYFFSRHWGGAAFCLTIFGATCIFARLLFQHSVDRHGGFQVSIACFVIESLAMLLLWRASASWMAFAGAALTGFGLSMVFPALGVEAVKRVPLHTRGAALGIFTAFADLSFFFTGPIAGAIIGAYGYASAFLFALLCVLTALAIVLVLNQMPRSEITE